MTPYRSILVVGGGTAGWLAAAYLQRSLSNDPAHPVEITLVEAPAIGTIGVGEATVPTMRQTMRALGIPETRLFAHVDATLKNGIRFEGWRTGADGDRYDHPFDQPISLDGFNLMAHWFNLKQRGLTDQAASDAVVVQTALYDDNRSPKLMSSGNYDGPIPYAYHLDAVRLAALLREVAIERGVRHLSGEVTQVETGEEGIRAVTLADGTRLQADLFVDCSGFRALLIGALEVPWISYADTLLCDRAVACPVAYASPNPPLRSYTTASAREAGWIWDIDLQSRRGTGYVYSSAYSTPDQAEAVLRAYHKGAEPIAPMRHLSMKVGHRARLWEKNCLALGLASGFIEPLESTAIYLIEYALQMFVDYLPGANGGARARAKFNSLLHDTYDELHDFVLLHYVLTERRDTPFWRAYADQVKPTPALAARLELWREKVPSSADVANRLSLFGPSNWFFILAGMGALPQTSGVTPYIAPELSRKALAHIAGIRQAAVAQSPLMRDFVRKVGAAVANAPLRPGRS